MLSHLFLDVLFRFYFYHYKSSFAANRRSMENARHAFNIEINLISLT